MEPRRLILKKVSMSNQAPLERARNFQEVALGYSEEEAREEAGRCLQCKRPLCVEGCPVDIGIPQFIAEIFKGDYGQAIAKIKERNSLPAVCGRVCPQESQCEKTCVMGRKGDPIAIGRLERFAADWEAREEEEGKPVPNVLSPKGKVAIVGGGPAGLTAAADLARMGYAVTIFEALHKPGGVLTYGIPEFRLPKAIVERELNYISSLGVEIINNVVIGKTLELQELLLNGLNGFKAVFIGIGAGTPLFMGIPGENLNGVYSANEFLTRNNLMKAYLFPQYHTPIKRGKRVAVIGGGNVAMDAARTALRLGGEEVYLVYRRSEKEMPARKEEVDHAIEEGIIFKFLSLPTRIIGGEGGSVEGIEIIKMQLGEPDNRGRARPIPIVGSEKIILLDTIIIAIGTGANPLLPKSLEGLSLNEYGYIKADPQTGQTSIAKIFAGGDIVTGAATVIEAMGAGKRAARAIERFLN